MAFPLNRIVYFFVFIFAASLSETNAQVSKGLPVAVSTLANIKSDTASVTAYNKIINYYSKQESDSAVFFARQGLELFKKRQYIQGQAWMVMALGDYDDTHGNRSSAEEKLNYALKLFSSRNDKAGMANVHNLLGVVEGKKGNFDKAVVHFVEAQKLFDETLDKDGLMRTWLNIGLLYDFAGDTTNTLRYYHKVDSLGRLMPLNDKILKLYNNLGAYYFEKHDTVTAYGYLRKAVTLSEKQEFAFTHIVTLMNMGEMQYQTGDKTGGRKLLNEALDLARKYKLPDQEANIMINFVMLFDDQPADSSVAMLNKALTNVKASGNKFSELAVYKAFQAFYEKNKNYQQSNEYFKLIFKLNDSLFTVDKAKEIENITSVYDLKQSNAKVDELVKLVARNTIQRNVIIGIAILVMAMLVVLYRLYLRTMSLNGSLEAKGKELEESNTMKDKLFLVIGHDLRGPVANIPIILNIIEEEVPIPAEYKDLIESLKEHANITIETLDKLMLLGKSAIKGATFNPVQFKPKQYVSKNIDLIMFAAQKKEIVIEDQTQEDISMYADAGHFDFVIRNLLSNAIKFSFVGGRIVIDARPDLATKMVVFSVKDNGAGMSDEAISKIFKGSVTSAYGTANEKGNGIALMLCREFVELNGGKIWLESKLGKGSEFCFSLKMAG